MPITIALLAFDVTRCVHECCCSCHTEVDGELLSLHIVACCDMCETCHRRISINNWGNHKTNCHRLSVGYVD